MLSVKEILKKADTENPFEQERVKCSFRYRITKVDHDQQIVHGVVYSPFTLDSHGHYMTATELEKTAHAFLAKGLQRNVDVQHDNKTIDAIVVESYIQREDTDDIPAGSWCAATKINDPQVWKLIKLGKLNGYSMEVMSYAVEHEAEIQYDSWLFGETEPDPFDGHTHLFLVKMNAEGNVDYGYTSVGGADNHRHTITRMSATDPYNYMTHRIILS